MNPQSDRARHADRSADQGGSASGAPAPTSKPIMVPLRALATNPNYFTDGSGKAIYLTGSHSWNTFQDWGTNDAIRPLDFDAFVRFGSGQAVGECARDDGLHP